MNLIVILHQPTHLNFPSSSKALIELLYFWPDDRLDTEEECITFQSLTSTAYLCKLMTLARTYTESAGNYIRHIGRKKNVRDRLNGHHLMELVVHVITFFGNGRMVSEFILEVLHQIFKKWFENNTWTDSQLTTVGLGMCRQWPLSAYVHYIIWKHGESTERELAKQTLIRIFFGEEVFKRFRSDEHLYTDRLVV